MKLKKIFALSALAVLAVTVSTTVAAAQGRDRVVKTTSSQPTNLPPSMVPAPVEKTTSRPTLTNPLIVVAPPRTEVALVKKTAMSSATNMSSMLAAGRTTYGTAVSSRIYQGIMERYGKPYRYGSTGPNTYDCSGFVWSVFNEAGVNFTRASARSLWAQSEPVYGDDRFKFGTLVFFNNLGHMGIVGDANGFFQASSSKGITFSPFAGYWSSRIVGYRRLKPEASLTIPVE